MQQIYKPEFDFTVINISSSSSSESHVRPGIQAITDRTWVSCYATALLLSFPSTNFSPQWMVYYSIPLVVECVALVEGIRGDDFQDHAGLRTPILFHQYKS